MIPQFIEKAGRTCYKSEDKITDQSADEFVARIINMGHESVIEHVSISVRFIVDRGVSHELVRHRLASFSQESTRYCDYGKGEHVTFIIPPWCKSLEPRELSRHDIMWSMRPCEEMWLGAMLNAEETYQGLRKEGWIPQQARSVLPNSLKTEVVMTCNLREWRLVFKQRTSKAAHPQMREVMIPLLGQFQRLLPVVFNDIKVEE